MNINRNILSLYKQVQVLKRAPKPVCCNPRKAQSSRVSITNAHCAE